MTVKNIKIFSHFRFYLLLFTPEKTKVSFVCAAFLLVLFFFLTKTWLHPNFLPIKSTFFPQSIQFISSAVSLFFLWKMIKIVSINKIAYFYKKKEKATRIYNYKFGRSNDSFTFRCHVIIASSIRIQFNICVTSIIFGM